MLGFACMPRSGFDLRSNAYEEMIHEGFDPDWTPKINEQVAALKTRPTPVPDKEVRDLRDLLWSSIDNDTSRDLDQVEVAERVDGSIRILIGIADVDSDVPIGSPIASALRPRCIGRSRMPTSFAIRAVSAILQAMTS